MVPDQQSFLRLDDSQSVQNAVSEVQLRVDQLTRLLDVLPDALITIDDSCRVTFANPMARRDFTDESHYNGQLLWDLMPQYAGSDVEAQVKQAISDRSSTQFQHTYSSPFLNISHTHSYFIYPNEFKNGCHIVYRDISKPREAYAKLKDSMSMLAAIVDSSSNIILAKDLDRKYTYANKAAAAFFGVASPNDIIGREDYELFGAENYQALYQKVNKFDDILFATGQDITYETVDPTINSSDKMRVLLTTKSPVRDDSTHEIVGTVSVSYDITERKLREVRDQFLFDLVDRIRNVHDANAIITEVINSIRVYMRASRCAYVEIHEASGTMVTYHESLRELGYGSKGIEPMSILGDQLEAHLRSGEPLVVNDRENFQEYAQNPQIFSTYNMRSLIKIPVLSDGVWVGIFAVNDDVPRNWNSDDVAMLKLLADRTWLTLENGRMFNELQKNEARQRRIADTLQTALILPATPDAFPGLEIDAHYEPASDEAEVGGDFGDVFRLDDHRVAILVGDCTGKGLEAARFVGECQFSLRAFLRSQPDDPAQALSRLNDMILSGQKYDDRPRSALTSVSVVVVDCHSGEAIVVVGGAEPPFVLRASTGEAQSLCVEGSLIGADPIVTFHTARIMLEHNDLIIVSTDGTTEARRPLTRELYGNHRLALSAKHLITIAPNVRGFSRNIVAKAKDFAGGVLTDDACVLTVRRVVNRRPILVQ